jgi:hypothetical protein
MAAKDNALIEKDTRSAGLMAALPGVRSNKIV